MNEGNKNLIPIEEETAVTQSVVAWAVANLQPNQVTARSNAVKRVHTVSNFLAWCGKHPREVTSLDVEAWRVEQELAGFAPTTVYARVSMISAYFKYLVDKGLLQENPVDKVERKRIKPYNTSRALSDGEVQRLLAVIPRDTRIGQRDYAMILTYLLTGRRRSEIARLRWADVRLFEQPYTIRYIAKGGETEEAELDPAARDAIVEYLRAWGRLGVMKPESGLFISTWACPEDEPVPPMSSWTIYHRVKKYAEKVGLRIGVHTFRHTFARGVADSGASMPEAQAALGHKNLSTTRVYVQRVQPRKNKYGPGLREKWLRNSIEGG